MMKGFYIREIRLVGAGVDDAFIKFYRGLNIVSGASDTGKTYVFECIEYMMGASNPPKEIIEARDYTHILMEIETNDGVVISFKRRINDKTIYAAFTSISNFDRMQKYISLDVKHDASNNDNISMFFLNRIGIKDIILLKKNKNGEKQTLSFRNICHLNNIDEKSIIKDFSPILSGQYVSATVEKSVFKYMLSGIDDEKCDQIEDVKLRKAKIISVIDFISEEIATLNETLQNVENELSVCEAVKQDELTVLESEIEEFENQLKAKLVQKKQLNRQIDEKLSEKQRLQALQDRFGLLEQHYHSDLDRLQFIEEGADFILQVEKVPCPICHSNMNTVDLTAEISDDLSAAYQNEQQRIEMQLIDLKDTVKGLIAQIATIDADVAELQRLLSAINNEINEIKPQLKLFKAIIKRNEGYIKLKNEKDYIAAEISRKRALKIAYEENSKKAQPLLQYKGEINDELLDDFCTEIENTLTNWCFDEFQKVTFDKKSSDIKIGDKERKSFGKGYRAFLYTAFVISMMRYTIKNQLIHPGVVILDSPLVTLKEKETGTDVPDKMQNAMFNDLAKNNAEQQVIIFENKQPTAPIEGKVNQVVFTKDYTHGRYGFFDIKNTK
ncbi:MAG: hypothetical protein C4550_03585 [Nitrospiraceae bacterium]|nr:MAG: hypothetical protein C4550_03585 [Nitrospiraceae bacterium]